MSRSVTLRAALALATTALVSATPALAVDAEVIRATAGYWFLAEMPAGRGCNLKLLTEESIGGRALEAPVGCKVHDEQVDDLTAWNFDDDGGLIFLNAVRKVVFRLTEEEDTSYTATTDAGDLALVPSFRQVVALPTPEHAAGTWNVAPPGGKPLCTVTLTNAPQASGDGNLALSVAAGCDKTIAALKLDGWMNEGVELVLHGAGDKSLAFIDDGNDGFDKSPVQRGKPLVMRRKR
jgi:hypothetical protein